MLPENHKLAVLSNAPLRAARSSLGAHEKAPFSAIVGGCVFTRWALQFFEICQRLPPRGQDTRRLHQERALRSINIRRGQPEFRKKLLKAYSAKCAISGYDCADALEAAHIGGYWTEDSNHVQNGLLLRSDLHTLFDLGKIGVDPKTFNVIVAEELIDTRYRDLNGKRLRLPSNAAWRPSPEVLKDHVKRGVDVEDGVLDFGVDPFSFSIEMSPFAGNVNNLPTRIISSSR